MANHLPQGRRIAVARVGRGWRQSDLVEAIRDNGYPGARQPLVSNIENGLRVPDAMRQALLAALPGLELDPIPGTERIAS